MSDIETSNSVSPLFNSRAAPYVWLTFGILLGLVTTMALLIDRDPKTQSLSQLSGGARQYSPESDNPGLQDTTGIEPAATGLDPDTPVSSTGETPDPPAGSDTTGGGSQPSLGGAPQGDLPIGPPKPLSGSIQSGANSGGPVPPVNPVVVEDPKLKEAGTIVPYLEFSVLASELDFSNARTKLIDAVKANGGRVLLELDREPEFPDMGADFFISVPKAKSDSLRSAILGLSGASTTDEWQGPFSERHYRVTRHLRDKTFELESRLSKLLVKYLDDAPEVLRTKRDIERFRKAESGLKVAPVSSTALRVTISRPGRAATSQVSGSSGA